MTVKNLQEDVGWGRSEILGLVNYVAHLKTPSKYVDGLCLHRICTNLDKMSPSDVLPVMNACRKLVSHLEQMPVSSFKEKEWVAVIQCLTQGLPLVTSTVQDCLASSETEVCIECPNLPPSSADLQNITKDLCRVNAAFIVGRDLFLRTLFKLFPQKTLQQSEKECAADPVVWSTPGASLADNTDRTAMVKQLLLCPWINFPEKTSRAVRSIGTCVLHLVGSLAVSEAPPPAETQFVADALSLHLLTLQITAFSLPDAIEYGKKTLKLYVQVADKHLEGVHLVSVMQGLLTELPLLDPSQNPSLAPLLWRAAAHSCSKITAQQPVTHNADLPKVPIASPESDALFAPLIESIMMNVPEMVAALNQQSTTGVTHSGLISICVRCLEALAQMPSVFGRNKDELKQIAKLAAALGEKELISQFTNLYKHLLECNELTDSVERELIGLLLEEVESSSPQLTNFGDLICGLVSAQAAVKESTTIVWIMELSCKQGLETPRLGFLKELVPLLTHTQIENLLPIFMPVIVECVKKANPDSEEDRARVSALLQLMHLFFRDGTKDAGKWAVDLAMTRMNAVDWCAFLVDIAEKTYVSNRSEQPVPATSLPPLNSEFLDVVRSPTSSLPVLTFFFRQYKNFFNEGVMTFMQNFNSENASFEKSFVDLVSRDEVCPIAVRYLTLFKEEIQKRDHDLGSLLPVIEGVFSLFSSSLTFTPDLCDAVVDFIDFLEKTALITECELSDSVGAVDRVHTLLRVWHNPLLLQALPDADNILAKSVIADVSAFVSSFIAPLVSSMEPIVENVCVEGKWFPGLEADLNNEGVVIRLLHSQLTADLLQRLVIPESVSPTTTNWLYKCHALRSATATAKSTQVAQRISSSEELAAARLVSLVIELLHGIADARPKYPVEVAPLPHVFAEVLYRLIACDQQLPWASIPDTVAQGVLDLCGEDVTATYSLTIPFLRLLKQVIENKEAPPTAVSMLVNPIEKCIGRLSKWLSASRNPLLMWNEAATVIKHLYANDRCRPQLMNAVLESVDVLFRPSLLDELHQYFPIQVQTTDRFVQTLLKWRGCEPGNNSMSASMDSTDSGINNIIAAMMNNDEALQEGDDPVKSALELFTFFQSADLHLKIASHAVNLISELLVFSPTELDVLRGDAVLTDDNRLVWRVLLLSNMFMYLAELTKRQDTGATETPNEYFSDDENIKGNVLRKSASGVSTSGSARHRKHEAKESGPIPLCTYKSTESEFVTQHWYNCYTCKMMDTRGVCSVCAVNCHRGHDLSYSKRGSFFCDCGDRGPEACKALERAEHDASSARSVKRGTCVTVNGAEVMGTLTDTPPTINLDHVDLKNEAADKLKQTLENLRRIVEEKAQLIYDCVVTVNEGGSRHWELNQRRALAASSVTQQDYVVKYSESIMTPTQITRVEAFEQRPEAQGVPDRTVAKELTGLVRTPNGRTLVLMISDGGTNLSIIHVAEEGQLSGKGDAPDWRVDTEPIGFPSKSISCRDDKCVIVGQHEFRIFRFGNEAEIFDRMSVRIADGIAPNPLVKAAWAYGGKSLLAVATQQFIRVYDVTVDVDMCVEELVLPLGNVVDMVTYAPANKSAGDAWVLVLSSAGHLYLHQLGQNSGTDQIDTGENVSFYLTNTINLPILSNAISMHFSLASNLLFVSVQQGTFYAQLGCKKLANGSLTANIAELVPESFKELDLTDPVHIWSESEGVTSCLSHGTPNKITFFYPTDKRLLVQTCELVKPALGHVLLMKPTADGHFSIVLHNDAIRRCSVFNSKWLNEPDLWIGPLPRVVRHVDAASNHEQAEETDPADLITIFEHATLMKRVEFTSEQLFLYYDSVEITKRLSQVGSLPLTMVDKENFKIVCRVLEWNCVIRGIRIEVPATKGPTSVTILGQTYSLESDTKRMVDIRLSRSQSLSIEKELTMNFTHSGTGPNQIISVQVFVVSRREFGWPRPSKVLVAPLSLPQRMLTSMTELFTNMVSAGVVFVDVVAVSVANKLCSHKDVHPTLYDSASQLLKKVLSTPDEYYKYKDPTVFTDLKEMYEDGCPLHVELVSSYATHLKMMMCTRLVSFNSLVLKTFDSLAGFGRYLCELLENLDNDSNVVAEIYCAFVFMELSHNVEESDALIAQFVDFFTNPQLNRHTHRLRLASQALLNTFITVCRADRAALASNTQYHVLGAVKADEVLTGRGALPFFGISNKLIRAKTNVDQYKARMGDVTPMEEVLQKPMFEAECGWTVKLLGSLVQCLRRLSEEPMGDDVTTVLSPQPASANSLVMLIIVLMAQLDRAHIEPIMKEIIGMINVDVAIDKPSPDGYKNFLILRLISILMSKCEEDIDSAKKGDKSGVENTKPTVEVAENKNLGDAEPMDTSESGAITAEKLDQEVLSILNVSLYGNTSDAVAYYTQVCATLCEMEIPSMFCALLETLLPCWRTWRDPTKSTRMWLQQPMAAPELSQPSPAPKYLDFADNYRLNVTELAMKLPIQMKKFKQKLELTPRWEAVLCQLIGCQGVSSVRRTARKLLLALCDGDKNKYRVIKDRHMINAQIAVLSSKYVGGQQQTHQQLTEMVDIMNAIAELAQERTTVWREICLEKLNWLLTLACTVADAVSGSVVELLVAAIRASPDDDTSTSVERKADDLLESHLADELISKPENCGLLKVLLVRYLIGRDENKRWLLHGMVRSTIQLAARQSQLTLMRLLWTELWPLARGLGSHGAQLADLIATYAPRLLNPSELVQLAEQEIEAINDACARMKECGHDATYRQMSGMGLGWKDAMLMDSSPCLVCTSKQDTTQTMKLSVIKQESRYTTNAQMIKLAGHYEISRVIIKLSDVKRTKTIRKVHLHYCSKVVESAVDLKNSPNLWQRVATAVVNPTDTEVVLSLAIPVVTSGLVIEFAELSESRMATELRCPRCSSVVQPNPGVCENCGENVFQCVKCRSINYDEKEPFLCNSCGFCKYARMEIMVVCRSLPSVCPITNDQEFVQSTESMGKLMSEMEQSRCALVAARALGEAMWLRTRPLPPIALHAESSDHAATLAQAIPQLNPSQSSVAALALCTAHCRAVHEELCTQTSQLIAYREELRSFELSNGGPIPVLHQALNLGFYSTSAHCFGCISASIVHSASVISAACDEKTVLDKVMFNESHSEFVWRDLVHLGANYDPLREEIELLLCRLAFENEKGTEKLCELVRSRMLCGTVLARSLVQMPDKLWQVKLKTLIQVAMENPGDENTSLSLLNVLDKYLGDARDVKKKAQAKQRLNHTGGEKKGGHHVQFEIADARRKVRVRNAPLQTLPSIGQWLHETDDWEALRIAEKEKKNQTKEAKKSVEKTEAQVEKATQVHKMLTQKYSWWLWECVFSSWVAVRAAACRLLVSLSQQPGHAGTAVALIITGIARGAVVRPGRTDQFMKTAQQVVQKKQVKLRLFAANFHLHLVNLVYQQSHAMHDEELHETTMDHWFGHRLRSYVELLCTMFGGSSFESLLLRAGRSALLIPIFQSTVFLKRILFKRTRAVDASRTALERLLKRISAKDPEQLMLAAVQSLDMVRDFNTQAQIVSVIVDVIHPVQKDDDDFLIQIEKDPAQDDFLQGRMTGNPYKSSDAGLGPLMRDIKNKICRDCELIALLEDENGMELLVNNQIVALNLPVKDVYESLWKKVHPGQPMMIIYRMRGLLGEAVEQFISNLNNANSGENAVDATSAALTTTLADCGGIQKALNLLNDVDLSAAGRFLFVQLKKLFDRCLLTEDGRRAMVRSSAVAALMRVFRLAVESSNDTAMANIGLEYLGMLDTLIADPNTHQLLTGVPPTEMKWLLQLAMEKDAPLSTDPNTRLQMATQMREVVAVREKLSRIMPNICIGDEESEKVLLDAYNSCCKYSVIDERRPQNVQDASLHRLSVICSITSEILPSEKGRALKDKIIETGVLKAACEYLVDEHPPLYNAVESPEWKLYLSRPCLTMVLSLIGGMATGHENSQKAIAEKTLHVLHRLEQVTSVDRIGTLAESVVDALKENPEVAAKIEAVRLETKQKKRQLAMAMRQKQLTRMGMQLGTSGEVKVNSRRIANEPQLDGEALDPLQSCCICRESIAQGPRVPCAYAYVMPLHATDGRGPSFTTVSQMVMVHVDCHQNAIRRTSGRGSSDEWAKASLHNAGVLCNVLMPICVGSPSEADWKAAVNKAELDISVVAANGALLTRNNVFVDMCTLIDKFVNFRSFSDNSKGGGRESNAQYLAVLHLLALSLPEDQTSLPITSSTSRVVAFLLTEQTAEHWKEARLDVLRASVEDAQRSGLTGWASIKPILFTWAFVDAYFDKVITIAGEDRLEWLKEHFIETLKKTALFVSFFDGDVAPCESYDEFADVLDFPPDAVPSLNN